MPWRHDELMRDLAAHLAKKHGGSRLIFQDMQLGPAGSPRPDVYTLPSSYARFFPLAYEIKTSRADFLSDVGSGKWSSYLKFASGVFFATPAALVSLDELPDRAGLIVRSKSGWRVRRKPALNPGIELPRAAWQKLLMDGIDRAQNNIGPRRTSEWHIAERLRKGLGERVARAIVDTGEVELESSKMRERIRREYDAHRAEIDSSTEKCERVLVALKARLGLGGWVTWDYVLNHLEDIVSSANPDARAESDLKKAREAVKRISRYVEQQASGIISGKR